MYSAGKIDSEGVLSAQLDLVNSQQLMVDAIARRQVAVAGLNNVLGVRTARLCMHPRRRESARFLPADRKLQSKPGYPAGLKCASRKTRSPTSSSSAKSPKHNSSRQPPQTEAIPTSLAISKQTLWEGNVSSSSGTSSPVEPEQAILREAQAAMARAKASMNIRSTTTSSTRSISHTNSSVSARHQLTLSRAAITVASEKRRIVLNKFQVGKASPTDVVDAPNPTHHCRARLLHGHLQASYRHRRPQLPDGQHHLLPH